MQNYIILGCYPTTNHPQKKTTGQHTAWYLYRSSPTNAQTVHF